MARKSLRLEIADLIGLTNHSPEALAIYKLVDRVEVLEQEIASLKRQKQPLDAVARRRTR